MKPKKRFRKNRILPCLIAFTIAASMLGTLCALAKEEQKVVRVGWYESSFNRLDDLGRRSGYAYEYQQKIALYTGWRYEYVEGSWNELLQMLKDGKIDLLSDVSYKKEREKDMLFSALPMGTEEYYLFTTPDNSNISTTDYSTFNGKKVGANKGSIQLEFFREWAKTNNVSAEIVELTGTDSDSAAKLVRGDIDLLLTLDSDADKDSTIPVCKIASSDFYFAVSKKSSDILADLNYAMSRIQDDDRFFNQHLYNKYLNQTNINSYLTGEEQKWLSEHGTVRFGYQDNYLAFCAKDPKTGELTGALKDYLEAASDCLENAQIEFEPVAFPTSKAALEALKNGEIDCMFPINLTDYYGETKGFSITSPLMSTEMSAIVSESNQNSFFKKERITVAVNAGNPNYEMFLIDYFPEWLPIYFKDTPECLKAISQGKADCLLMSSFRYSDVSDLCEKYKLVQLNAGVKMDYNLAVKRDNAILYSILNKIISAVPDTMLSSSLSRYSVEEAQNTFSDYLKSRPGVVAATLISVLLIITFFLVRNTRALKRARENRKLISATETDSLTGLYMKNYFFEYANRLYLENPEQPMDAIVVNIIHFHSINAINGRVFGDRVLRALSEEMLSFLREHGGIAGHMESDHFAIYCPHLEDSHVLFNRLQRKLDSLSSSTSIRLRMGVMPYEKGTEPQELVEHALVACNLARELYKDHMIVFDENMRQKEDFEHQLLNDINRAIKNNEFVVYYQPKFNIKNDPPTLCGAEALVRWNHPKFGFISSSDFVPLFERNGQISTIDNYVWRQTAKQAALWKEKYGDAFPISINLSRIDIFDSRLKSVLDSLLSEYGLDHDMLELEVTESAYTENADEFIGVIENLRKKGYKVQMDDFGTGYSSLSMLSLMPIDALKMDKTFITDINFNTKRIQLVELILDIAEDLNIPVIAEGVENEEQLNILQDLGCAIAQGFYFAKPLPADRFEKEIIEMNISKE